MAEPEVNQQMTYFSNYMIHGRFRRFVLCVHYSFVLTGISIRLKI